HFTFPRFSFYLCFFQTRSMKDTILVIGAKGQIGSELVEELRKGYGSANVIATDVKDADAEFKSRGPFIQLDVLDRNDVFDVVRKNKVNQVYLLAAMLSAVAEQKATAAWRLN